MSGNKKSEKIKIWLPYGVASLGAGAITCLMQEAFRRQSTILALVALGIIVTLLIFAPDWDE